MLSLAKLGIPEVMLLGRYQNKSARRGLDPHAHAGCLEICFLDRGRQVYEVEGKAFHLSGGDLFITFPGEEHSTALHPQDKGVLYWIILQMPERAREFLGMEAADGGCLVRALLDLPKRHFAASPGSRRLLDAIIEQASTENHSLRRLRIRQLLIQFLLSLIEAAAASTEPRFTAPVWQAIETIHKTYDQDLKLAALAASIGISLPRFKARFKQEVGVPPGEYRQRYRIEKARHLLRDTDKSVTEIAHQLGFSSSQYFSTVFRQYTRQTPSTFRSKA